MSCEGCDTTQAAERQKFEAKRKEAKEYAKQVQQDMAIYKEGFEYRFIRADIAIADGYIIKDIVSKH